MSRLKPNLAIPSHSIPPIPGRFLDFLQKFHPVHRYLGLNGPFYNCNIAQKIKFLKDDFLYTKLVRQGGARLSYQEHEKTIQETLNYIEQHLKDDLPLQTLAKHAGYSRFHFHRIFKN